MGVGMSDNVNNDNAGDESVSTTSGILFHSKYMTKELTFITSGNYARCFHEGALREWGGGLFASWCCRQCHQAS